MKDLTNNQILEKTTNIIANKFISFICIALSAGITGILLQDVHIARGLHAIGFGLTCGLIALLLYAVLFSITYCILYLPKISYLYKVKNPFAYPPTMSRVPLITTLAGFL